MINENEFSIHRICQLKSAAQDIAIRFLKDDPSNPHDIKAIFRPPNMYDIEEAFRLHGLYFNDLSAAELEYFNQELNNLIGETINFYS